MTRAHLLLTSALVLAASPALAQTPPASGQLPTGMRVVAGQASAAIQGSTLQVTQRSGRAALDWSSFNIGSRATVRFQDPSAQAMTLNRVSGPDASTIAGHLTSNGQIVLINQSGVVFMPGAVVDAQSVVISAAGITEAGMRRGVATGHFVLDQPAHPGARVVNQGRISVRRAGLAALVAPQVANHGTISAPFGTVTLAGVTRHVVDLYGDGLLSIDVSRQTVQGSGGQAALVTNDGVIAAEGGRVTLSTDAVEGVVDNLVEAGGSISADSAGRRGGIVLIDAEGGTATVTGTISARGVGAGASVGGEIAVRASQQVNLTSKALLDASGRTGGGVVAIGTTLARARGGVGTAAPAARLVGIAPGARVLADATRAGQGGQITVLSTDNTVMAGLLSARGGAASGNGGKVEVSGTLGLSLVGLVDVTAAHGNAGGLTIDPTDLVVQSGGGAVLTNGSLNVEPPPANNTATIDPNVLEGASGNVTLISLDNLDVRSGFSLNSHGLLTMTATDGTITVGGAITNNGGGIVMAAGSDIFINSPVTAAGALSISAGGSLTQAAGAAIASTGASVVLSAGLDVKLSAPVTAATALNISAGNAVTGGALTQNAGAPLTSTANAIALSAGSTGAITLADAVSATNVASGSLNIARAGGVVQNAGAIDTPALFSSGGQIPGSVSLTASGNNIARLGAFSLGGNFTLVDDAASLLTVNNVVQVGPGQVISLTAPQLTVTQDTGGLSAGGNGTVELSPPSGAVTLGATGTGFSLTDFDLLGISASVLRIGATAAGGRASGITVSGLFDATDSSTTLDLQAGAGGIAINAGPLVAGTLLLGTSGTVTQAPAASTAIIDAATLDGVGSIGGIALPNASNGISVLGSITSAGGAINVAGLGPLVLSGPISTGGGGLTLNAGGAITLAAAVDVGALSLTTRPSEGGSDVLWTTPFSATSITGSIAGNASLTDSYAGAASLGAFAADTLVLHAVGSLTTTGAVNAPLGVTLSAGGMLDIASSVTGSNIDLSAATLTEDAASGSLNAVAGGRAPTGVLTSALGIGGNATLLGANTLNFIEGFKVGGTLSLLNVQSLAIGSGVAANSASFHVTHGGSIQIGAPLAIPTTGTLSLQADNLVLTGGTLSDVVTNATGTIDLIAVAPDSALTVALGGGAVSGAGTLAISNANFLLGALRANTLQLGGLPDGTISASNVVIEGASLPTGVTLLLDGTGGLTQTGALAVDFLGGKIGAGGVDLANVGNSVGALDGLSVGGNATLVDAAASLSVNGAVTLTTGGALAIAVDRFGLGAGGSIGAGSVAIGPLHAGHSVGIGDSSGAYDIELGDLSRIAASMLTAGNSGIAGTQIATTLVLAGDASFAGTLVLDAGLGGVAQSGGALSAGVLAGAASGGFDVAGGSANLIRELGGIQANSVDIADATGVQVAGVVAAASGPLSLLAPSITVDAAGSLSAAGGVLGLNTDALAATRPGAVADAGTVSIAPYSDTVLTVGPAAGEVDLSVVSAATIELASNGNGIRFSGAVKPGAATLLLNAANSPVTETTADSLTVGTLEGVAGSLTLPGGNLIGSLAGFTVGQGNLLLTDASALAVTAPVVADGPFGPQTVMLRAPSLTLDPGSSFAVAFNSPASTLVLASDTLSGAVDATVPGGTVLLERITAGAQSFAQSGGITAGMLQVGGNDLSSSALRLGNLLDLDIATLRLETSGAVTQTGALVAPSTTLTGQAGSVTLDASGNTLGYLGDFSTTGGAFTLADAAPLTVAGDLSAGSGAVTLTDNAFLGFGLTLAAGSRVQAASVTFDAAGGQGVTQDAGGVIDAGTLDGNVLSALLLDGAGNAVGAVGTLFVGGLLRLADTQALTEETTGILVAGTLEGTFGASLTLDGASNAIANLGAITAAGTLSLTDANPTLDGVVQAEDISLIVNGIGYAGGSLIATGVASGGGTVEIAPPTFSVLNLGTSTDELAFISAGVLANVDADLLILGEARGRVTATGIAVNAPVLVSGQVATVDLEAAGPGLVTELPGASFGLAGTLIGNTGAVALNGGPNAVPTLGPYTVSDGTFALIDSGSLAIEGDVLASGITLAVAGALTLDQGSLLAAGGTVDLTANGASEVAGTIAAATLDSSGSPAGNFSLAGPNQVDTLGSWNATGALTLVDQSEEGGPSLLTVAGPVSVTALALRAAAIRLAGNITTGGAVDLSTTAGGVAQTAGTLSAGVLSSAAGVLGGDVLLGAPGNRVDFLSTFGVPGHNFTLTDASKLGVIGALSANAVALIDPAGIAVTAPITASRITVRGGGLAIGQNGVLFAPGGTVDLVATGATEIGNGVIRAASLLSGGTPSGVFVLGGANSIDTLGTFLMAPGGMLLLADTTGLSVTGAVSAAAVDLSTTTGGIAETTGGIATGLLSSSFGIAGGATFDNAGNAVAALGNIHVTSGDFSFAQAGALAASGTVGAANIAVRIGGALQIGNAGTLQAGGTVDLTASGAGEANAGAIAAAVLDSTQGASGVFTLGGANRIAELGVFTMQGGTLALTDAQALMVSGPVGVQNLALFAPALTLNGNVTAGTADFGTSAGPLAQQSGTLGVDLLTSLRGVAGSASLMQANQINGLGAFAVQGSFALTDLNTLPITGAVSAPGGLHLVIGGDLVEAAGGSIATSMLSGQAGLTQLNQPGNAIGSLAFATAPQSPFELIDQQSLTVDALSGGGAALADAGAITLAGNVSEAGAAVALNAAGAVSQTGGTLAAGLLQGSAASMTLAASSNAISALGNVTAPGGLRLANRPALAILGAVQAGVIDLSVVSGGITEPGGALLAGQLVSSSGIVGDALLTGANQVAGIGPLSDSGRFEFADTRALTVGNIGAATIDLSTTSGGITQTGPLTASTLTSSFGIVGGAQFSNLGNRIGTLGAMPVAGGDLVLADDESLTVAGPVSAPNATLAVAGSVTQAGDVVVPGTFSTTSLGPYQRVGGALSVGTLTGRAVSLANFGAGAAVQRVGAFTVNDADDGFPGAAAFSNFALSDATPLTLAGPLAADYIRISATGTLIWSGDLTTLGLSRYQQDFPAPTDPGTWLEVVAGPNGTAQILQTGVVHVFSQDAAISTVRLQLPTTGGTIAFSDLEAPTTDLLLFIGAGTATGRIDVADLLVSGRLGGTELTGDVRGLVGSAAARESELAPFLDSNYRINSCPIQSVNCILLPIETVPQQNPLRDLAIGQASDEMDDSDVLLPNVAEQDY